jgi:hypothetical protein
MEQIVQQISDWIEAELNGLQDPDELLTLRVVRPKIVDWQVSDFKDADVIMEFVNVEPYLVTDSSRLWLGEWKLYGILTTLPAGKDADDMLDLMSELIISKLLGGNKYGRACEGLAVNISCPDTSYGSMAGGVVTEMIVNVRF